MPTKGELILLSGFSGAGKTTLVKAALEALPSLRYVSNYTTRPPRDNESPVGTFEYIFVSEEEYEQLRNKSDHWDHGEYYGYSYGTDVDAQLALAEAGHTLILAIVPDINTISRLQKVYDLKSVVIWIDVSLQQANTRIEKSGDIGRIERLNADMPDRINPDAVKQQADYVFTPTGSIADTNQQFIALVQQILAV